VADGSEISLSPASWSWVDSVAWSEDDTLAIDASNELQDAFQIWHLKPREARITRITNDLSNYRRLTLTNDGKVLAALQTRRDVDLWVTPVGAPETDAKVVLENLQGFNSLAWSPDEKILFSMLTGGRQNVWTVNSDGSNEEQITAGPSNKQELALTRDGRYILYSSHGTIWRMNPDGGNPLQLTKDFWDVHPTSSADSHFVLYTSFRNWSPAVWGKPTIWKVPIGGGEPVEVVDRATSLASVSPDGSEVACDYYSGPNPEYSPSSMAIFSMAGGSPREVFSGTPLGGSPVFWAPDGKALLYGVRQHRIGNLWQQPLPGGKPVEVTGFVSGDVFAYAFSKDFRRVALARGEETSDIVLINSFR
jgi:WD40 repeat protein